MITLTLSYQVMKYRCGQMAPGPIYQIMSDYSIISLQLLLQSPLLLQHHRTIELYISQGTSQTKLARTYLWTFGRTSCQGYPVDIPMLLTMIPPPSAFSSLPTVSTATQLRDPSCPATISLTGGLSGAVCGSSSSWLFLATAAQSLFFPSAGTRWMCPDFWSVILQWQISSWGFIQVRE